MSLFLAAAAGFLSGKAERAKEKREEERIIREEERQFEKQRKLYELQHDMQSRARRAERAEEMAQQVVTLLRLGIPDETAAVNIVSSGMFEAIRDAAAKGELNMVRVMDAFGEGADETEVDVDSLMAPSGAGLYITKEEDGGGSQPFNSFARAMQGTLGSLFPEGSIEFTTTAYGDTVPIFSNRTTRIKYDALLTRAFDVYSNLSSVPEIGKNKALLSIKDYLLKSPFDVNNEDSFNALVDGLSVAAQRRLAPVYIPDVPEPPPPPDVPAVAPAVTEVEQTGAAGVIPVNENRRGRNRNRYGENTDVTTTQPNTQWGPNVNFGQ